MQQGKRSALIIMFRSAYCGKPHVPVKAHSLRVLLIHINESCAQDIDRVPQKLFSDALSPDAVINKKHFYLLIGDSDETLLRATVVAATEYMFHRHYTPEHFRFDFENIAL